MVKIIIFFDGSKIYYLNNLIHRDNQPAMTLKEDFRTEIYYVKKGDYHRLDGPAVIRTGMSPLWYYNNVHIRCNSQEEFERLIKLKLLW